VTAERILAAEICVFVAGWILGDRLLPANGWVEYAFAGALVATVATLALAVAA
jgi:hypothetical protein